jgi:hypothetical protein
MSWSYSKLSTYERCPAIKKYRYDLKVVVEQTQHPAAIRGTQMHDDLETHVGKNIFEVPEWMRPHVPHLEKYQQGNKEFKIRLTEDWEPVVEDHWLICIIDLSFIEDGKWATIVDYKSGKRYESHQEQIELYNLATLAQYPDVERVEGKCYYLDEPPGSWGQPVFTLREQFDTVRDRWLERVTMMDADTECAPRTGYYCKWCDYRKSNGGPCTFG